MSSCPTALYRRITALSNSLTEKTVVVLFRAVTNGTRLVCE